MPESKNFVEPVKLAGRHVVLEPLHPEHAEGIKAAVKDGELWNLWFTSIPRPEDVDAYIDQLLSQQRSGKTLPFAVRDKITGNIVGCTRYLNIESAHRRLEIGGTWYALSAQRTGINTECKLLLLTRAFEELDCVAVEFRTDWFNHRSQAAIERLGAKRDGVLRNHMVMPDGRIRDTVVYSIIRNEWSGVKTNLLNKLR